MVAVGSRKRQAIGVARRGTRIYREVKSVNTLLEGRQVTPPSPTLGQIEYRAQF